MNRKNTQNMNKATFAGGCFWCMEPPYKDLDGVEKVVSGYTGGHVEDPTYQQVSTGTTGHYEAVQIMYNPQEITFQELLDVFWRQIDPTDPGGSFADRGSQYKTAIFYHNQEQKRQAEESRQALEKSNKFEDPIATEILEATEFYEAEDYHQNFYLKNPQHYKTYKKNSGRKDFIEENWGG